MRLLKMIFSEENFPIIIFCRTILQSAKLQPNCVTSPLTLFLLWCLMLSLIISAWKIFCRVPALGHLNHNQETSYSLFETTMMWVLTLPNTCCYNFWLGEQQLVYSSQKNCTNTHIHLHRLALHAWIHTFRCMNAHTHYQHINMSN